MTDSSWKMNGEYMESCNCDYLCPCLYTNPQEGATLDNCIALLIFQIESGSFEKVDLAGLKFALLIKSQKVMSDGGWVFGSIVDEDADDAQRAALTTITSGEAGGVIAMIRNNLVSDYRGVEVRPIEFRMDGMKRSTSIPGALEFAIEGVESRTGNGEPMYADNTAHPVTPRLALARSSETHVHCLGIDLDMSNMGNNGHYAPFSWSV